MRHIICVGFMVLAAACGSSNGGNSNVDGGGSCETGDTRCTGNTYQTCPGGTWTNEAQCATICDDTQGCVECEPGAEFCQGDVPYVCADDGSGSTAQGACEGGLHCEGGACRNLCAAAAGARSYIGCEYWAVDLDNAIELDTLAPEPVFGMCLSGGGFVPRTLAVCKNDGGFAGLCQDGGACGEGYTCQTDEVCVLDAQGSPFAIVVSNPQTFPVGLTISVGAVSKNLTVMPGAVLPMFPQQMGFPDQSVNDSGLSDKQAYKVVADAPIVAYQFNPLNNVDVFSNDGSLLLPRATWDVSYTALSWPTLSRAPFQHDYNGYLTVVAWQDDTEISVTPTAAVRPGAGFPAMPAGETRTFTLDQGQLLNLEAVGGTTPGDLTGSRIVSSDPAKTIGVFTGHEATAISDNGDCCADHLEEMMFPTSTWGSHYVVARSKPRAAESDLVRIVALEDGTSVTLSSGSCPTLSAGGHCDVDIASDVEITASKKVVVGHLLKSTGGVEANSGDPDLALAVPTAQWRSNYTFLVPSQYNEQYVSIATAAGKLVYLDGVNVTAMLQAMPGTDYAGGRIQVQPGQHKVECADGCGIEVYGYAEAVGYLFAGGLDLKVDVE